jgi:hypothetical protein
LISLFLLYRSLHWERKILLAGQKLADTKMAYNGRWLVDDTNAALPNKSTVTLLITI